MHFGTLGHSKMSKNNCILLVQKFVCVFACLAQVFAMLVGIFFTMFYWVVFSACISGHWDIQKCQKTKVLRMGLPGPQNLS